MLVKVKQRALDISNLGSSRSLLCGSLLLGDTDGLAGFSGASLFWSSLCTSVCSSTLLGCSGGTLGDSGEDSRTGVSYVFVFSGARPHLRAEL